MKRLCTVLLIPVCHDAIQYRGVSKAHREETSSGPSSRQSLYAENLGRLVDTQS